MHGDAFTAGHVANHRLSADGITTAGAINQQVAVTLYANGAAVVSAKDAAHDAANAGVFVGRSRCGFRNWREFSQHLPRRVFAVSDGSHEIVGLTQTVVGSDALKILLL